MWHANRDEPGAWRVEVSPPRDETGDLFLVVLLPTKLGVHSTDRVRLLESGNKVGCEIVGPKRTTRWWFEPGQNQVDIDVAAGGEWRSYRAEGMAAPASARPNWFEQLKRSIRAAY